MENQNVIAGLKKAWNETRSKPDGNLRFSALFGKLVPYSSTIEPLVVHLEPGHARIQMQDRELVRNHLNSVHAVALMNLGEMTSGLALAYSLPDDGRSILTNLSMEYLKKARGTLTAECRFAVPEFAEPSTHVLEVPIRDEAGEVVAKATATWLVDRKA
ncbi:MAG TPA: hotdog fold domain-containing protein [Stenomitos sp.]